MQVLFPIAGYKEPLKTPEFAGRVCYSSHPKIEEGSDVKFIGGIIRSGHCSVIEHSRLVCNAHKGLHCLLPRIIAENEISLAYSEHEATSEGGRRIVVSGNFRAWRDAAEALKAKSQEYRYLYTQYLLEDIIRILKDVHPVLAEGLEDGA